MTAASHSQVADGRVPGRFEADPDWSRRYARTFALLTRQSPLTESERESYASGLLRRDELAAAVVRAMREEKTLSMRDLSVALKDGIEAVPHAPEQLRDFLRTTQTRPEWVDDDLLELGARASRRPGADSMLVLAYGSLLGGYRASTVSTQLASTGRLNDTDARRRVAETIHWWLAVTAPGGMRPGAEGFRLSQHVRLMHALVNHHLETDPTWDFSWHGVPINQFDLATTLGSFSTSFILHCQMLGVRFTAEEQRALLHLWSYVGWVMGVDEEWLPGAGKQGRRVLYAALVTSPPPDKKSEQLGQSLIDMHNSSSLPGWRKRFARAHALSMASYFHAGGLADIGVSPRPPWAPLPRVIWNVVLHHVIARLPRTGGLVRSRTDRSLQRYLATYFGEIPAPGDLDQAGAV